MKNEIFHEKTVTFLKNKYGILKLNNEQRSFQMKNKHGNLFFFLLLLFSLFLLGACGKSVQKSYLQRIIKIENQTFVLPIEHQGDKPISTESATTVYYKGAGVQRIK